MRLAPRCNSLAYLFRSRGAHLLAAAAILLIVIFVEVPGAAKYSQVIQNSGHAPAFGLLALLLLDLFKTNTARPWRPLALAFISTVTLGIGTELAQAVLHRDAEVQDVIHDAVGALCALSVWVCFRYRHDAPRRLTRAIAATLALITFGTAVAPLVVCAAAYRHRHGEFPVIAQFSSPLDLYFIEATDPHANIVRGGLHVGLEHGRWPGITLNEPSPDWSRYSQLFVDVSNPGQTALPLSIRVNDRQHNFHYEDRFTREFAVAPTSRLTVRYSLEEIASAPRGRRMDMRNIATVIIFRSGAVAGQSLVLHRIWLQ